ncbi:MAG TPA: nuclear transport factor 2 family protein [Actinokineospora sp.]|jgi:3-phenylpropionate/cinnamic acid dioxygenase small subunit|nr:nuclear transport factor 2 family protein [Actinokineospora sp.]
MEAVFEITQLVYRLGACLDDHRFDDLVGLFTADATARTPGGEAAGRDAVIAQATRNHEEYQRIQHLISNVLVDVDGSAASVRANLVGTFVGSDGAPVLELGAVYRFGARRVGDGWRLSAVEVEPLWRTAA